MLRYFLWCGYAGSSFEVKIETGSNDAMEMKTEADIDNVTECLRDGQLVIGILTLRSLHDERPSTAMFGFYIAVFSGRLKIQDVKMTDHQNHAA